MRKAIMEAIANINQTWAGDILPCMNIHDSSSQEPLPTEKQLVHLVEKIIDRDESALSELYDITLAKVYGLAMKITRRFDLAEEVAEDTYWQVWHEAGRFDAERGSVMAWIMLICRSRSLDLLRRQDRAESHPQPDELAPHELSASPLDLLLVLERSSALHGAMSRLTPIQRQLVALAFFKGYTHEEIAQQTCIALGSVKSHIKRAQSLLKAALTNS